MKSILFVSNYYYPYISGVTEFERMIAEEMARRGYKVKVITSKHDKALKTKEVIHGVEVKRCAVQLKISKGTISIPFIVDVVRESKKFDVVNMQLPMLESGLLSLFIKREKLQPMYHCDMNLPSNGLNKIILKIMDLSHNICMKKSRKIWVSSLDYAEHSRIAYKYVDKEYEIGLPIKNIPLVKPTAKNDAKKIGFCGRIVEEKGIDVLLKAYEKVKKEIPNSELLIGGDYKKIAGGSVYPALKEYIDTHNIKDVIFLGKIPEEQMGSFYATLDVLVLPSVNSLEAFGMVQVEAMMCGTPVVSSDLYGVRTVVQKTGMGIISKKADPDDLARCIMEILTNRCRYVKSREYISSIYSTQSTADKIGCLIGG